MKKVFKSLILIGAMFLALSCSRRNEIRFADNKFEFNDTVANINVNMIYPYAEGNDKEVVALINDTIMKRIINSLSSSDSETASSLDQFFNQLAKEKSADTVIGHMPYEYFLKGTGYASESVSSVFLDMSYFTGGAHPANNLYYINFNTQTGKVLDNSELFSNMEDFTKLNRDWFVKCTGIDTPEKETESCMFVSVKELPLPENIGFNQEGVVMAYGYYEIGCRVLGNIIYTIPYAELEKFNILTNVINK